MNYSELQQLAQAEGERQKALKHRIYCCTSTSCLSSGSDQTLQSLEDAVVAQGGRRRGRSCTNWLYGTL
jgi:NADH:ubiquinone oxidoreductase subunit E